MQTREWHRRVWAGPLLLALWSSGMGRIDAQAAEGGETGQAKKFAIPVWHPDARWKLDEQDFAHDNNLLAPDLDGSPHEVMWGGHYKLPTLRAGFNGSGRYVFMGYDDERERYHHVTGGAAGSLDGPFSRARFYVSDYHGGHERAYSPDGRYFFWLDDFYKQQTRALDFAEQKVLTLPAKGVAVACGESGNVYLVQDMGPPKAIVVLSPGPEFKQLKSVSLQGDQKLNALGTSVAVDEKHERLYATTYGTEKFYVWYWDLKDGSFHGVLPRPAGKDNGRAKSEAGPFEGTNVYNHGEIAWGPDDPDKRFLYMTRVDTYVLHRLDLERKVMAVFSVKEGRFKDEGAPDGSSAYSSTPYWAEDGSFLACIPWYAEGPHRRYFRRVK